MITPFYDDGIVTIIHGDSRVILPQLAAGSIHSCVTSPPYFGLRDYGGGAWVGGDEGCEHVQRTLKPSSKSTLEDHGSNGRSPQLDALPGIAYRDTCGKCGATRQDQQMGLEPTPALYVAALTGVFEEVRRVLRSDGTAWLNLADSYASEAYEPWGIKPKDEIGIPDAVVWSLRRAGWWRRSTIIWSKGNPMPESVRDRVTKSHEYLFLLAKAATYYFDQDAIREPHVREWDAKTNGGSLAGKDTTWSKGAFGGTFSARTGTNLPEPNPNGRNKRSVWTINTQPFPGAHFAVMPEKLVEPCVLAGVPSQVCAACGAPWVRQVERETVQKDKQTGRGYLRDIAEQKLWSSGTPTHSGLGNTERGVNHTTGFAATCHCDAETIPGTVLDPFGGSGTVAVVAKRLGRRAILIEQNLEYCRMAADRIEATPAPFPYEVFG